MVNVVNELLRDRWTLEQTLELLEALRAPMQVISWLNGRRSLTDSKEFMLLFRPSATIWRITITIRLSTFHYSIFAPPHPSLIFVSTIPISIFENIFLHDNWGNRNLFWNLHFCPIQIFTSVYLLFRSF